MQETPQEQKHHQPVHEIKSKESNKPSAHPPYFFWLSTISAIQLILVVIMAFQLQTVSGSIVTVIEQYNGNQGQKEESDTQGPIGEVSADDDPTLGKKDAPVAIIAFSDAQCPYCARFHQETLPFIIKDYIETGKAKFVLRDFPLEFHQHAALAAQAAECADKEGKFWEYTEKLLNNQQQFSMDNFILWSKELGLNEDKFTECLSSGEMKREVEKDLADGKRYGVSGTPAFFVNGQLISGAQPYSVFMEAIEKALQTA